MSAIIFGLLMFLAGFLVPRDAFPWMQRLSAWLMRNRDNTTLAYIVFLVAFLILCVLVGTGCKSVPFIRTDKANIQATRDAGKPATLAQSEAGTSVALPEGSKVVVTEIAALPATEKEEAKPAKVVTEILPAGPTEYRKQESAIAAGTGTVDTSIAKHRIDVEERRWLLWAAIGCGIAGIVVRSMLPAWPAISNGLLLGAAFAFASWKLSEIPAWLWGAVLLGVGVLVMGYKRGELDANKNGIPDVLERKSLD